jgi:ABC-type amino acid transport substrate-binding protein
LGIASGRYDVALINIAVTEKRKEKFDFATYLPPQQDPLLVGARTDNDFTPREILRI